MEKVGKAYFYRGEAISKNYGGWVIVNGYDYNIYKTLDDATNAIRKSNDGSNKKEPVVIGTMNKEQFIHAFVI